MRNARGHTRYQVEGCGVLWNRLAMAAVFTLVHEFILVAFLISIGHLFYVTHCCRSVAQSHLEVGDVFREFLVLMCRTVWSHDSEDDVTFLQCRRNLRSCGFKLDVTCLHK
jgi:hypothetical protein